MSTVLLGMGFLVLAVIFRLPWRMIPLTIVVYWAAALLAHVLLPLNHPICHWFGGTWQSWAATGVFGLVVGLYVLIVRKLKKAARQVTP